MPICKVMPIPKNEKTFRVECDGEEGLCFSYYDHFRVFWDCGSELKTIELSLEGIRRIKSDIS